MPSEQQPRFAVFLTPAADDFAYAQLLMAEVGAAYDASPFEPHVTLHSGPYTALPPLREALTAAIAGVPPFSLRVKGIGWSAAYFRTLFVEFEETPQLRAIHERLRRGGGDTGYEFNPHLSLLYRDMPSTEKEALARVHLERDEFRFDAVKIVVPRNLRAGWRDTGRWQTVWRMGLGGAPTSLRAVLFDFGGVLAEEGFREGLRAIARSQGLDPVAVHRAGMEAVYVSGYVLGRGTEADFWRMVRQRTGVHGEDAALTAEILSRFVVRPRMLAAVRALREKGYSVAILSDQTDWLERLDARDHFFADFDRVFNSYRLGTGKLYPEVFTEVVTRLGVRPEETLFVDDLAGNVERAAALGLRTLHGEDEEYLLAELERLCGIRA